MDIFESKLKDITLYQTVDLDGEPQGIVATLLSSGKMEKVMEGYNDYFEKAVENDEDVDMTVDGLVGFMARKGYPAERVFIEDDIVLPG